MISETKSENFANWYTDYFLNDTTTAIGCLTFPSEDKYYP